MGWYTSVRDKATRVRSLSWAQWRVVLASGVLIPSVALSLRLGGFRRTAGILASRSQRSVESEDPDEAREASEAVGLVAGKSIVGSRCLCRSLVLWFILRRRGVDAELVIGADVPIHESLAAHAWVEVGGEPVNDGADVRERYGSFGVQLPRLAQRSHS